MKIGEVANQNWFRIGDQESASPAKTSTSFSAYLTDALNQVGALENEARMAAQDLATGDASQMHQVMIAYEKASLALDLTIEIRNKMVESYQEIMRIQM